MYPLCGKPIPLTKGKSQTPYPCVQVWAWVALKNPRVACYIPYGFPAQRTFKVNHLSLKCLHCRQKHFLVILYNIRSFMTIHVDTFLYSGMNPTQHNYPMSGSSLAQWSLGHYAQRGKNDPIQPFSKFQQHDWTNCLFCEPTKGSFFHIFILKQQLSILAPTTMLNKELFKDLIIPSQWLDLTCKMNAQPIYFLMPLCWAIWWLMEMWLWHFKCRVAKFWRIMSWLICDNSKDVCFFSNPSLSDLSTCPTLRFLQAISQPSSHECPSPMVPHRLLQCWHLVWKVWVILGDPLILFHHLYASFCWEQWPSDQNQTRVVLEEQIPHGWELWDCQKREVVVTSTPLEYGHHQMQVVEGLLIPLECRS